MKVSKVEKGVFVGLLIDGEQVIDEPSIKKFNAWLSGSLFGICGCVDDCWACSEVGEHSLSHRDDVLVCRSSLQSGTDITKIRFASCCDSDDCAS